MAADTRRRLPRRRPRPRRAFTLVELMIVVAIIAILLVALIRVGSAMVTRGHVAQARAIMSNLDLAATTYARERTLAFLERTLL